MNIRKAFLAVFLLSTLSACTTPQHSFDNDLKVGMDKAEVIELMGGPQFTKRRNSEDVWQYHFYNGENKMVRELHFKNNKLSYKGDPVGPKPGESAKAIDSRNSRQLPSFSASDTTLTPKQKQENLERYIKEDEEAQAQKPAFKEL
jgi:outer membrane protein assembly factor BamE (lipoprotein component of BamABCDE complex)